MTRRAPALALILVILLTGLLPAVAVTAASSAPIPTSMAAVGDSITQAASSGGSLGADYPANSWSTGTNSTVNSHFLRLRALSPNLVAYNRSVSGAKVADLPGQMQTVVSLTPDPGYLTVLIGGNDLCTSTVGAMTSEADFRSHFTTALQTIMQGSPETYVYVASIPNVYQLWNLFKGDWWARFIWNVGSICQSLLANATSTQAADVQRREQVRQRNIAFNAVLEEVCESPSFASRCRFDNNAVFNTTFTASDVSGDYFHPSIAGQAKLASVSWGAGYAWATTPPPNLAPTASFTSGCVDLLCSFTDTSADADGTITTRQWAFGDGTTSTATNPSHTYTAGGSFTVTLTVTDDDGESASISGQVTVTAPEEPPPDPEATLSVADLDGSSTSGKGQAWTATVTISVADDAGSAVAGATVTGSWSPAGSSSCTTGTSGSCSVSVSVNAKKATSTTFTVTDVVRSGYAYVSASNTDPDTDSDGTSITVDR